MALMIIVTTLGMLAAGVVAGMLTTIAGLGGGILLIAALSMVYPPALVLALTAPALFIGNASRVAMLHRVVDWPLVARFALTGVPTAFVASLLATSLPAAWLRLAVAGLLVAFIGHELLARRAPAPSLSAHPWLPAAAGAVAGTVSGLTGGAGFIATPLLERLGLTPQAVVATSAACMGLVHLVKGVGYGLGAALPTAMWPAAGTLAVGVVAGNALGTHVLARMSREAFRACLLGALGLAAIDLVVAALMGR